MPGYQSQFFALCFLRTNYQSVYFAFARCLIGNIIADLYNFQNSVFIAYEEISFARLSPTKASFRLFIKATSIGYAFLLPTLTLLFVDHLLQMEIR